MINIFQLEVIETPRLIIRPMRKGDEVLLHEAIMRSIDNLKPWMPWAREVSPERTQYMVERSIHEWDTQTAKQFSLVVVDKASGDIIAATGYNDRTQVNIPIYEIGYWIDVRHAGKGLVTEYVNALTRYAFEVLGGIRVQIVTQVGNDKSSAVATRCGFRYELAMPKYCLDCLSRLPAEGLLFAATSPEVLPELAVSWQHKPVMEPSFSPSYEAGPSDMQLSLQAIYSARLLIKPPSTADLLAWQDVYARSQSSLAPIFSWAAEPTLSSFDAMTFLENAEQSAEDVFEARQLSYFLWYRKAKALIGEIRFNISDWSVMTTHCSFWLDPAYRDQGLMFEALQSVMRSVFDMLYAERVTVDVAVANTAARELMTQLNFTQEGLMQVCGRNYVTQATHDRVRFALTEIDALAE